jgi:hypothetical protein
MFRLTAAIRLTPSYAANADVSANVSAGGVEKFSSSEAGSINRTVNDTHESHCQVKNASECNQPHSSGTVD